MLDTPGVLWPKFETQEIALNLAFTGTIKEEILDKEEIAFQLTRYLLNNHLEKILEKYKLDKIEIQKLMDSENEENEKILEVMEMIGKARGAYMSRRKNRHEKNIKLIAY